MLKREGVALSLERVLNLAAASRLPAERLPLIKKVEAYIQYSWCMCALAFDAYRLATSLVPTSPRAPPA